MIIALGKQDFHIECGNKKETSDIPLKSEGWVLLEVNFRVNIHLPPYGGVAVIQPRRIRFHVVV